MKKFILTSCIILLGLSYSAYAKQTDYILCSVESGGTDGFISQVTSGGLYIVFAIDEEYMTQIGFSGNKDAAKTYEGYVTGLLRVTHGNT